MAESETFLGAYFSSRQEARHAAAASWPGLDLTHPDLPVVGTSRGVVIWLVAESDPPLPASWQWQQARMLAGPLAAIGATRIFLVQGDEDECLSDLGD